MKPSPSVLGETERTDDVVSGTVRSAAWWPRVNQRSALRVEELPAGQVPRPLYRHLAGAAGDDVLVTLATALGVVGRPKSVRIFLDLLEDESVVVERTQRHDVVFVQLVEGHSLRIESVRDVGKSRRRLRRGDDDGGCNRRLDHFGIEHRIVSEARVRCVSADAVGAWPLIEVENVPSAARRA